MLRREPSRSLSHESCILTSRIVAQQVGTSSGLQNQRSAGSIPAVTAKIESLFIESFFIGPSADGRSKRVSAANDSVSNEK